MTSGSELADAAWSLAVARSRFTGAARVLGPVELLPPVDRGREVFAGGANYGKHVELGLDARSKPTVFAKSYRSLIGARSRSLVSVSRSPLIWTAPLLPPA